MLVFSMLLLLAASFALLRGLVAFSENVIRSQASPAPETFVQHHGGAPQRKTLQVHTVRQSPGPA